YGWARGLRDLPRRISQRSRRCPGNRNDVYPVTAPRAEKGDAAMNDKEHAATLELPGDGLEARRMPGHWLLARLGKRVLRPGGIELTRTLIEALDVGPRDDVVEFAPGLGITARMALSR